MPEAAEAPQRLRRLPRSFFARTSLEVAPDLIGKLLVHRTPDGVVAGRIVETEAYMGPADRAAHSWNGRRTARTEAMYLPGGHAYVFFLYGMHWAFNVVCAGRDEPQAVLVRAVEPLHGREAMARRRGLAADRRELTNGPGKLCAAMGIGKAHYGADLCARGGTLHLAEPPGGDGGGGWRIGRSPRINVDYAGADAARPWRFYARGHRYVSVPPRD